jgi:hypothetical protein
VSGAAVIRRSPAKRKERPHPDCSHRPCDRAQVNRTGPTLRIGSAVQLLPYLFKSPRTQGRNLVGSRNSTHTRHSNCQCTAVSSALAARSPHKLGLTSAIRERRPFYFARWPSQLPNHSRIFVATLRRALHRGMRPERWPPTECRRCAFRDNSRWHHLPGLARSGG